MPFASPFGNLSQSKTNNENYANHRQSESIREPVIFCCPYGRIYRKDGLDMDKETMSVQEFSTRMGISLPKAYALTKEPDFPVIRIGTRILIPVDAFKEWLVIHSQKEQL